MASAAPPKPGSGHTSERARCSADKHALFILAQINKMRGRHEFCDVQLQVGEELFSVHRLVLAASSPYFAVLFAGRMCEASKDVVQILGVEADIFTLLLDFIYTGVVNVTVSNVQELIVAADMLQLTDVVTICCEFLKGQMDPANCVGIYQFSEQIACYDLLEFAENYIHVHFLEIPECEEFTGLTKDQLVRILQSEELRIEDEYQVFTAAMEWVLKDVSKRKKYVVEVLDPVRFSLLSPQRLYNYIEGNHDTTDHSGVITQNPRSVIAFLGWQAAAQCHKKDAATEDVKCHPLKNTGLQSQYKRGYTRLQGGRWSDSRALSCVERFDTFSQFWTTVSSLHQARSGLGVAVLEGMIYVIGGEKDSMIFDCAERYDPVSKQWASVASMNYPRCGLSICACHGVIYALGGWIGEEIGKTIECYDPLDNKWEIVGSMAVPRYYFGCCEIRGGSLLGERSLSVELPLDSSLYSLL
nr:PREDICTED: actin-binding protein IPP [Latimeria chalumnae]|eukprot:XP_014344570.1 PREDICTED: actin-binding protein IPP [Latimeria chalumnae]